MAAADVGEDDRLQEPHLRVLRLARQHAVDPLERRRRLARMVEPRGLAQVVGERGARGHGEGSAEKQPGGEDPELHR